MRWTWLGVCLVGACFGRNDGVFFGDEGCCDTFGEFADFDGDGFVGFEDCDDGDPQVFPGAPERCNQQDDDCDGQIDNGATGEPFWPDGDGDGYGDAQAEPSYQCEATGNLVDNNDDCDDGSGAIRPRARELCDGVDNDCDGTIDGLIVFSSDLDGGLSAALQAQGAAMAVRESGDGFVRLASDRGQVGGLVPIEPLYDDNWSVDVTVDVGGGGVALVWSPSAPTPGSVDTWGAGGGEGVAMVITAEGAMSVRDRGSWTVLVEGGSGTLEPGTVVHAQRTGNLLRLRAGNDEIQVDVADRPAGGRIAITGGLPDGPGPIDVDDVAIGCPSR